MSYTHSQKISTCKLWHHCVKLHTADLLAQARDIVIKSVQRETYLADFACLEKGKEITRNCCHLFLRMIC